MLRSENIIMSQLKLETKWRVFVDNAQWERSSISDCNVDSLSLRKKEHKQHKDECTTLLLGSFDSVVVCVILTLQKKNKKTTINQNLDFKYKEMIFLLYVNLKNRDFGNSGMHLRKNQF